jgi:hypothetical protein
VAGGASTESTRCQLITTAADETFIVVGTTSITKSSSLGYCALRTALIVCSTKTLVNLVVHDSVWNPTTSSLISVGRYATYPTVIAMDSTGKQLWNFIYQVNSLESILFSAVGYLPAFVGTFIAGPGVSKNTGATLSIVSGWFHSSLGRMYSMLSLVPQRGSIVSTAVELVYGLAVEEMSLDTIVTGGISIGGGGSASSAYIVRFNALFQSVAYGMRYVPVSAGDYSIGKAVLSVGSHLFLVCDAFDAQRNRTQLGVLKVNVATGSIVKQIQIAGPATITCSSATFNRGLLIIACGVRDGLLWKPLLFTVDQDFSFRRLLAGYQRVLTESVQAVPVAFVASVITVSQSSSMVAMTSGAFNSSAKLVQSSAAPTRLPTRGPTQMQTQMQMKNYVLLRHNNLFRHGEHLKIVQLRKCMMFSILLVGNV